LKKSEKPTNGLLEFLEGELYAEDIILVTFSLFTGNWKLNKAGDCPTSLKKQEEVGWGKSFLLRYTLCLTPHISLAKPSFLFFLAQDHHLSSTNGNLIWAEFKLN